MRHLLLLLPVALLLALTGCGSSSSGDGNGFTTTVTTLDPADQAKSAYAAGETVRFRIDITWNGRREKTVQLPAGLSRGVVVRDTGGAMVWHTPMGGVAGSTPETWQPGQTRTLSFDWNQLSAGGTPTQVPAGTYRVEAEPNIPGAHTGRGTLTIVGGSG